MCTRLCLWVDRSISISRSTRLRSRRRQDQPGAPVCLAEADDDRLEAGSSVTTAPLFITQIDTDYIKTPGTPAGAMTTTSTATSSYFPTRQRSSSGSDRTRSAEGAFGLPLIPCSIRSARSIDVTLFLPCIPTTAKAAGAVREVAAADADAKGGTGRSQQRRRQRDRLEKEGYDVVVPATSGGVLPPSSSSSYPTAAWMATGFPVGLHACSTLLFMAAPALADSTCHNRSTNPSIRFPSSRNLYTRTYHRRRRRSPKSPPPASLLSPPAAGRTHMTTSGHHSKNSHTTSSRSSRSQSSIPGSNNTSSMTGGSRSRRSSIPGSNTSGRSRGRRSSGSRWRGSWRRCGPSAGTWRRRRRRCRRRYGVSEGG